MTTGNETSQNSAPLGTQVSAKWAEIKGDIIKSWNKLSDSDLESTKGDQKSINALLQKNYGATHDTYSKKITDIFERYDAKKVN